MAFSVNGSNDAVGIVHAGATNPCALFRGSAEWLKRCRGCSGFGARCKMYGKRGLEEEEEEEERSLIEDLERHTQLTVVQDFWEAGVEAIEVRKFICQEKEGGFRRKKAYLPSKTHGAIAN